MDASPQVEGHVHRFFVWPLYFSQASCSAGIVLIMQSGLTFVNRILGFLLEVFYWRALAYIALSIGCFFTPVLIVGGILLDLLAIAYIAVAYFFKEREYYDVSSLTSCAHVL